jgi:hypothetical protein
MRSYVFVSYAESGAVAPQTALLASLNEFYAVTLADEKELHLLMSCLGIALSPPILPPLPGDFDAIFDYSDNSLPMLSPDGFDIFYEEWLRLSGRESTMDEYGQLLFLNGLAARWNARASRFILRESI